MENNVLENINNFNKINDVFLIKDDFIVNNSRVKTIENKKINNNNNNKNSNHLTLPPIISNKNNHHKIVVLKRKNNNKTFQEEENKLILTGIDYIKEKKETENNLENINKNEENNKNENKKENKNEENKNEENENQNEKKIKKQGNFANLIDLKDLLNDEEKLAIEKIEEKKFKEQFLNDNNVTNQKK